MNSSGERNADKDEHSAMTPHQTVAHDSDNCILGPADTPCDMCVWASQQHNFDSAWSAAPTALKRVTEQECAEWFYLRGRQDERSKQTVVTNDDLREIRRLVEGRSR
jgi:hypothetical protein